MSAVRMYRKKKFPQLARSDISKNYFPSILAQWFCNFFLYVFMITIIHVPCCPKCPSMIIKGIASLKKTLSKSFQVNDWQGVDSHFRTVFSMKKVAAIPKAKKIFYIFFLQ